jgi:perosamine synthetase
MERKRIPLFRPQFSEDDVKSIAEVLQSGYLTTGEICVKFEAMFAERIGVSHAISTSSCSAALHLIMAASDIGTGDIVFIPSLGFASDILAVEWQGATPVLVDCEPESLCINPEKLQNAIEEIKTRFITSAAQSNQYRLKAVISVDYAGQMADYSALRRICKQYNMLLIEDGSHALPSYWRQDKDSPWHPSGCVADIACFSFYPNKPMTTGEGGMIVTNDDKIAKKIRCMRSFGFESRSSRGAPFKWDREITCCGYKYNLPDIAAALGIRQLEQLDQLYQGRLKIAQGYSDNLRNYKEIKIPEELPDRKHSWHIYAIQLKSPGNIEKRDSIMLELYNRGIETSVHWVPLHMHKYFSSRLLYYPDLSITETIYPSLISLPVFPSMSEEELNYVTTVLIDVLKEYSE